MGQAAGLRAEHVKPRRRPVPSLQARRWNAPRSVGREIHGWSWSSEVPRVVGRTPRQPDRWRARVQRCRASAQSAARLWVEAARQRGDNARDRHRSTIRRPDQPADDRQGERARPLDQSECEDEFGFGDEFGFERLGHGAPSRKRGSATADGTAGDAGLRCREVGPCSVPSTERERRELGALIMPSASCPAPVLP